MRASTLRNSIVASFSLPAIVVAASLSEFTERDWRQVLRWLDLSGLALYFLDRLRSLGLQDSLPPAILERLEQRLADNRQRNAALFSETVAVSRALKEANISFALLKGITLAPDVVADVSLRCQMDIDILIRTSDAMAVRGILENFGYELDAVKGQEWSFVAGVARPLRPENLYKARPQRMIEIHLLPREEQRSVSTCGDRLSRARLRTYQGVELPGLSAADLFVQQAIHIFKHLCSENTRAQWVLEYWRNLNAHCGDRVFWREVAAITAVEPNADLAIAAVTLLTSLLLGEPAPHEVNDWSPDRLPAGVRLWIETYGRRILLADSPANKFYMLLRDQLFTAREPRRASGVRFLFPFHWWPARITRGEIGEKLPARFLRYVWEAGYMFRRLQFHLRTSLPYAIELRRWQRLQADRRL